LKGLEKEALAFSGTNTFADAHLIGSGIQPILAYLKSNPKLGWEGVGTGEFDPLAGITAQQYYKVMLEALGYKQGTDFEYANTIAFAEQKGLTRIANVTLFKNLNIASATIEALNTKLKGSTKTLATELVDMKMLDSTKLAALSYTRLNLTHSPALGDFLSDSNGRTFYYFTKDVANPNSCTDACLTNWPVYYSDSLMIPAEFNAADFGVNVRPDGTKQTTYKGWPLYYFANDVHAGDAKGEAIGSIWYIIKPSNGISMGTQTELGNYLTDAKGMTLYYFDKDTTGVSNCSGTCSMNWPAFYAPELSAPTGISASDFGTLVRADGSMQTTYKGFPLYYWAKDQLRGDTTGHNVNNVWFVVDPGNFSGTTAVNTDVKFSKSDSLGSYFVDANGMTLYLFLKDSADPNACTGKCIENWPIFYNENLTVSSDLNSSDFGAFMRKDGAMQSTYKGWPLYYWAKDKQPGETTGQNMGNVWFVLNPEAVAERVVEPPIPDHSHAPMPAPAPAPTPAPAPAPPTPAPAPAAKTYTIIIENFEFSQSVLTIEAGSTVTWLNKDEMEHNAVAANGSFALPLLAQGQSGSFTFTEPGEYEYFCEPHKSFMKAKIIVQ
jgi:predicted lipoprotein with Yx(FWY)xxD motif/plastocyanin